MDEINHHASTQAGPALAPKLDVVKGENAGESFRVKQNTKIGRERDNDIILLDLKASRHHAQITLEAGRWMLEDLGSANGTYLNDMAIISKSPLQSGDRIRFGETELLLTIPGDVAGKAAPLPGQSSIAPAPAQTTQPSPVPMVATPRSGRPPLLAWIAGGVILLVCFVAVFVIYLIASRIDLSDSTAENVPPPPPAGTAVSDDTENTVTPNTLSPSVTPPADLVLSYEDDFSDSFGGWDDAFDTYTRKVYGNNRYQIEVNTSNLVAWGLANRDVADFEIEVEARQEDGDVKNSYGLLFRFTDRENFYRYDISGDGFYLLSKFVDGEWVTLVDWAESEFINKGNTSNILKVSAFGPNITIWANGQQLASITDNSLTHGNFGFFAGTFSEPFTWVSYDNLKMWTPPGQEITLIPTATRPAGPSTEEVASPTAPPTATPLPEQAEKETPLKESVLISPLPSPVPTATSVPLPEYASRDQTLARGEQEITGRIVFPVYDAERSIYDIFLADIADGDNMRLVQKEASQPALTKDGAEIAYRSWQPDKRGLFARPLTGETENAWGFDLFFESARPQFSPADRSLMFFSRTGGDAPAVYRVIDGVSQVMRREGFPIQGKSPKWSPDGQRFAYSSCLGSDCGIILSNIDGSAPFQLTNHPSDTNPEFSPDGASIVFMSERGGNWEIYRVDIDGSNLIALTSDSASDGLPTWSPDGSKIAFVSNRDGQWAIFTMDAGGSNKRRHFVIEGVIDGIVQHDIANSFGWIEENIDWIP
jgi:TolB protein